MAKSSIDQLQFSVQRRDVLLEAHAMVFLRFCLILFIFLSVATQVNAAGILLEKEGGVYVLPVRINKVITLKFVLDSGASEVSIPADVALTLLRTGTIKESDLLPGKTYSLADGSTLQGMRFMIQELNLGPITIENVPAIIAPVSGNLLLGQSLLERLDSWTLDNHRHVLIVGQSRDQRLSNENTASNSEVYPMDRRPDSSPPKPFLLVAYDDDIDELTKNVCTKKTEFIDPKSGKKVQTCYKFEWNVWVKTLLKRTAGSSLRSLEADSGTQIECNSVLQYPNGNKFLVFSGCRTHMCPEANVFFLVEPKSRVMDVIRWKSAEKAEYYGPDAKILKENDVADRLQEVWKLDWP